MATFGIASKPSKELEAYLNEIQERLLQPNVFMRPFEGSITTLIKEEVQYWKVSITPTAFKIHYIGIVYIIATFLIINISRGGIWTWWYLPGIVLLPFWAFWTSRLYYYIIIFGKNKKGIHQKIKYVRSKQICTLIPDST